LNGSSFPLLPPVLGGGFGGVFVIITRVIELSRITLVTTGLMYNLVANIFRSMFFKCKKLVSELTNVIIKI
jgi:hypothetical protein